MGSRLHPEPSKADAADGKKADTAQALQEGPAKAAAPKAATVPYSSLYRYASVLDVFAMFVGILGAIVNGAALPLFALVFGQLIDSFGVNSSPDALTKEVNQLALYFVYLAIAALVASYLEVGLWRWTGQNQIMRMRREFLETALYQDVSFYDTSATSGDVLAGLNEDCSAVQAAISEKVASVMRFVTTFIVAIGISFWRGWELTLVLLASTPVLALVAAALTQVVTRGTARTTEAYSEANTLSNQAITNIRTVASFNAEKSVLDRFMGVLDYPTKIGIRMATFSGSMGGIVNGVVFCTYAFAFWYGARLVRSPDSRGYTGGAVLNIIFGTLIGGFALGQAGPSFANFATGQAAGARIMRIIDRKPNIDVLAKGTKLDNSIQGNVRMTQLVFSYPTQPDVRIFDGLDLAISAGTKVALVGQSGSGKSTIIQLLQRFYDPLAGTVTVDGYDLKDLQLEWYRSQVGLVSQEPVLFGTTIGENIRMGAPDASEEEVIAAAKSARAHQFVSKLPDKYNTQVGERGVQLSGGQKQRIAIARALLKNPRLLLLDEATSALDNVSERLVQIALDTLAEGRTTIIVAHRLSTIRSADKICVLQEGRLVEEGPHATLYQNTESVYHSLVKLQEQAMDKRAESGIETSAADADDEEVVEAVPAADTEDAKQQSGDDQEKPAAGGGEGDEDELTEEEKAAARGVGIWRLLALNRKEWPYLAVGVVASGAAGLVFPLFAIFLSELIAVFYKTGLEAEKAARTFTLLFVALAGGFFFVGTLQAYMFAVAGSRLALRVRKLFFEAVLRMEIGWFDRDENSSGALTARLGEDAPRVRGAVGDVLGVVVQNLVTLATGYTIAFINGWRMTLVITAAIPLLAFSSYMEIRMLTDQSQQATDKFALANQAANESIHAIRTVHSYNLQQRVVALYNELVIGPMRRGRWEAHVSGLLFGLGQACMFLVYAFAFWYGGQEVSKGRMELDNMLKVFFSVLIASAGLSQAQLQFPDLAKGGKAVARVFRVVDRESLIDSSREDGDELPTPIAGRVELQGVMFTYPTRPDVTIFKDFNLVAEAGQVTALVGESGSGKSTVVSLVERFYDPVEGQVLLDGVDVRSLKLPWLRSQVGLVSQEPVLFNGTILENIALGAPKAKLDDVLAACKAANAMDFIDDKPDKLATLLGEGGGISLSGGQKQRIAIARAILKDPRVMLLDEATSALDAASERLVQEALEKLMWGRTSIVIAHRLTTVRDAHKICVVQQGVVLEQGTHDQLMQQNGAYIRLARAQAGN